MNEAAPPWADAAEIPGRCRFCRHWMGHESGDTNDSRCDRDWGFSTSFGSPRAVKHDCTVNRFGPPVPMVDDEGYRVEPPGQAEPSERIDAFQPAPVSPEDTYLEVGTRHGLYLLNADELGALLQNSSPKTFHTTTMANAFQERSKRREKVTKKNLSTHKKKMKVEGRVDTADNQPPYMDGRERIPTGLPQLDAALGGGITPGTILNFWGKNHVGKTTLARRIEAAMQSYYDDKLGQYLSDGLVLEDAKAEKYWLDHVVEQAAHQGLIQSDGDALFYEFGDDMAVRQPHSDISSFRKALTDAGQLSPIVAQMQADLSESDLTPDVQFGDTHIDHRGRLHISGMGMAGNDVFDVLQQEGLMALATEGYEPTYAEHCGVDVSRVLYPDFEYGEQALQYLIDFLEEDLDALDHPHPFMYSFMRAVTNRLVTIDSVDSMKWYSDDHGARNKEQVLFDNAKMADRASILSKYYRVAARMPRVPLTQLFITQVRMAMAGSATWHSGKRGNAFGHNVRLEGKMSTSGRPDPGDVSEEVEFEFRQTQMSGGTLVGPGATVTLIMRTSGGMYPADNVAHCAIEHGIVEKRGSWLSYLPDAAESDDDDLKQQGTDAAAFGEKLVEHGLFEEVYDKVMHAIST